MDDFFDEPAAPIAPSGDVNCGDSDSDSSDSSAPAQVAATNDDFFVNSAEPPAPTAVEAEAEAEPVADSPAPADDFSAPAAAPAAAGDDFFGDAPAPTPAETATSTPFDATVPTSPIDFGNSPVSDSRSADFSASSAKDQWVRENREQITARDKEEQEKHAELRAAAKIVLQAKLDEAKADAAAARARNVEQEAEWCSRRDNLQAQGPSPHVASGIPLPCVPIRTVPRRATHLPAAV